MKTQAVLLVLLFSSTIVPCLAQNAGYPSYGFRSYSNQRRPSQSGLAGCPNNNSFNTGLSGYSQTSNGMVYSSQRSSQAAQQLAQQVSTIWSHTAAAAMNQQQVGQGYQNTYQNQYQNSQQYQSPQPAQGMLPQVSKQEMLRVFLEGGTPQANTGYAAPPQGSSTAATSTAYNNYQTAQNEAQKAYNASQRVRYYDRDTWSRKNDASTAEYAANNANYAAQRAESAAYNGDSQARGYANLARQAANRARQNANQARYNADTMK